MELRFLPNYFLAFSYFARGFLFHFGIIAVFFTIVFVRISANTIQIGESVCCKKQESICTIMWKSICAEILVCICGENPEYYTLPVGG